MINPGSTGISSREALCHCALPASGELRRTMPWTQEEADMDLWRMIEITGSEYEARRMLEEIYASER